ncbi:hypothetical protein [Pelagibacterium mangrovi]|uniref:hypothetical protein n=1 Tax=Pelagibacterium mangrovi TaxID=3119828 RepID=UPI002FCA43E7
MIRAFVITTALLAGPIAAQDNIEWTISVSGGSEIEIPIFMTEGWVRGLMMQGEDYGTAFEPDRFPVQLRQYRTDSTGRPFDYLENVLGANADAITYSYDHANLGAISGYTNDRTGIFYGMCRKERVVICFDMHWPKELQETFGPIVERIAKGFREGI